MLCVMFHYLLATVPAELHTLRPKWVLLLLFRATAKDFSKWRKKWATMLAWTTGRQSIWKDEEYSTALIQKKKKMTSPCFLLVCREQEAHYSSSESDGREKHLPHCRFSHNFCRGVQIYYPEDKPAGHLRLLPVCWNAWEGLYHLNGSRCNLK